MWLDKIFCKHEWEERRKANVFDEDTTKWNRDRELPLYIKYLYICKKCGKIKIIKF